MVKPRKPPVLPKVPSSKIQSFPNKKRIVIGLKPVANPCKFPFPASVHLSNEAHRNRNASAQGPKWVGQATLAIT
ncbi:hypothetical protein TNIN_206851 [Trichonephila inaurata madagascariensis]|uniref:Uncharacterized protein n=1 Tax=Trichonephila inaurata madagascariensis TaxID=2747483 RepID=A0A8X6MI17_9ARAC|nr:hypothetical protein TNIN_206851 [Trichonephila inaurata madagascariensis]